MYRHPRSLLDAVCVRACVCSKKYAKNKSFTLSSTKECVNRSFDLVQFKLYFNKYFVFITYEKKALAFIPRKYLSCLCFDKCLNLFSPQVLVPFQGSLLRLAVCHLIMSKPRFRRCNLMLRGSFLTLAL